MFAGQMSRDRYTRAVLVRLGLFVAATAAFPFLLYGIATLSNCRSVGGACGAVGLVVSLYGKPPIYLLFVASFIGITIKRLRDLRLPVALAAIVPLLMLADFSFGVTIGAPWSLGFVLGAMGGWPRYLFMALVGVALLCIVPTPADDEAGNGRRWGYAGAILLGGLVFVTFGALMSLVPPLSIWFGGASGVAFSQTVMRSYAIYGIPVVIVALVALVAWQQRR